MISVVLIGTLGTLGKDFIARRMPKLEIVTRPTPPPADYATREWVERIIDRKLDRALKLSETNTNQIVSGFAARLFKQFPKAIAQAIMDANPELTMSPHALTHTLEQVFATDLKQA